jgi:hypothetical protein
VTAFSRYIGIDYSGAKTPTDGLDGLRVYIADVDADATEVQPPPSPRKYWTRRGLAQWLVELLSEATPTIVGIDHAFSFPLRYFEAHQLPPDDWGHFLDDFQRHWPTDAEHTYVDFVRNGSAGDGAARMGSASWRRMTEQRAESAKSVFHFEGQGTVAKATHAGIPWLRFLRQSLGERVHFWPFDGWQIPAGRSAVVEVHPALWKRRYARDGRNDHQQDAFAVATWLRDADSNGRLGHFLDPDLDPSERLVASIEGWILGVQ